MYPGLVLSVTHGWDLIRNIHAHQCICQIANSYVINRLNLCDNALRQFSAGAIRLFRSDRSAVFDAHLCQDIRHHRQRLVHVVGSQVADATHAETGCHG